MKKYLVLILCAPLMACLTTRGQLREDELKTKVTELQTTKADAENRFQEYDGQFRELNGRVEVLEKYHRDLAAKNQSDTQNQQNDKQILDNKFKLIEEALLKFEKEIQALQESVEALKVQKAKEAAAPAATSKKENSFTQGDAEFTAKNWKKAIASYQSYRDANPKGQKYSEATYKIGLCFSELGMKSEAKAFLDEVVEKFPKTRMAEKAQLRLKNLK